jgi:hypothetical protein
MAEVVKKHVALDDTWDMVPKGMIMCNWTLCDFMIDEDEDNHWRDTFARHVSEALSSAGFGLVKEAQAGGWDEGFKQGGPMHDEHYGEPDKHKINPYRAAVIEGEA